MQNDKYYFIQFHLYEVHLKLMETESRLTVTKAKKEETGEVVFKR